VYGEVDLRYVGYGYFGGEYEEFDDSEEESVRFDGGVGVGSEMSALTALRRTLGMIV